MENLSIIRALTSGDQIIVAEEALDYTKSYFKSDAFLIKYEKERQAHKPKVAELNQETREMYEMQLAEYREMYTPEVLDMLPEEAKAGALYELKRMEAALDGNMDPEDRKNWEFRYPAEPNDLLIRSIKDFLEITKDVDFNATTKLNPKNNHQVFTNPVYEKKDTQWKACFRAGMELTNFVRAYSQDWLSELERQKKNG
ncbi:hypothetical protein [Muriicola jejuensis]|uniref:Uncharacterized protein n=1 Tax=Muriicola jejuensis TaxID=504488 RepID=A0A6P0UD95_9FLAO|nr:hypothetical protein [Muriicola jejuensis]NER11017.1 hypothetical protein [Muriicola jejuensis]